MSAIRTAPRALVLGCAGERLDREERAFFRDADPWGFILFARNVTTPAGVAALVASLKEAVGREAPVFIDQEGGRIQRLKPPHWRAAPPPAVFGALYARAPEAAAEALALNCRLIAGELKALGIRADCIPCLDVPSREEHGIIGDRAFSRDPKVNGALGRVVVDTLLAEGVLPVVKHLPGHGRARVDSHEELPVVEASLEALDVSDFAPFRTLMNAPAGMTAHVVYTAIDPDAPATTSRRVVEEVIRMRIGFGGLLLSDDLCMKALSGSPASRAAASFDAGCDVALHCNGAMDEMRAIAEVAPALAGPALERARTCEAAMARAAAPGDAAALSAALDRLLGQA